MRHVWVCFIPTGCMVGPDYERYDAPAPVSSADSWMIEAIKALDILFLTG